VAAHFNFVRIDTLLSVLTRVFVSPDVGRHPTAAGHCSDGLTGYFIFFKSIFLNPIHIKPKILEFQSVSVLTLHSRNQPAPARGLKVDMMLPGPVAGPDTSTCAA
jgi:hypothetical protein